MNDRPPPDRDDDDLGSPVAELRELREEPDAGFLAQIRGSIHRRLFASDSVDFAVGVFFATLLDYLDLIVRTIFGDPTTQPDETPGKETD